MSYRTFLDSLRSSAACPAVSARMLPLATALALSLGCVNEPGGDPADSGNVGGSDPTATTGEEEESSTSGVTTGDDETTGGEEDEGTFLPDDEPPMGFTPCDHWAQDCEEGEKCTPVATVPGPWDANVCVPVGDQPPGSECTLTEGGINGEDTCDNTSMCYDIDPETGFGTCVELCTGAPENALCPITGETCQILNGGVLPLCLPACEPLVAGSCPEGQNCVAAFEGDTLGGFICFPPAAEGITGESCECANCCADAHMCTDAASYGPDCAFDLCCTELCSVSEDAGCLGSGQVCVALFEATDPLYADVGSCMIPM